MIIFLRRLVTACLAMAVFAPVVAAAQQIRGSVVDSISGEPVVGAMLRAVAPGDQTLSAAITDGAGLWILDIPADPSGVALQLRRLGYANQSFDYPANSPAGAPIVLRAMAEPIRLAGVTAGAPQCGAVLANAPGISAIWQEVRKALEMSDLGARTAIEGYEIERSFRALDLAATEVLADSTVRQVIAAANPYRALSIEKMTADGWVEREESGSIYYAPDATVLASDAFERQHCFGAITYPDSVVLHFEPTRERARLPDIEGEIVLGGDPLDLRQLRFRYVGRGVERSRGTWPHGEVTFLTAPNGLRVVREWWVRVPIERFFLSGIDGRRPSHIMEESGRVNRLLLRPTRAGPIDGFPQN